MSKVVPVLGFVVIAVSAAFAVPALAGGGPPSGPVKKDMVTHECFMPANLDYSKVVKFVPFKTLKDCLKSGGWIPIHKNK